jgi:small subunit ribosomal protein S16
VLRIRLRRVGKKKQPQYRLVIADSRAPRDGAFIETIGTYNPLTNPASVTLDEDRAKQWLSKGAVPSDRVVKILAGKGLVPAPTFAPKTKKAEPKSEDAKAAPAAAKEAAPAAAPAEAAAADAEAPAGDAAEAPAEA